MKKFLFLFVIFGCSHRALMINGEPRPEVKLVQKEKYQEIIGAGDVLKDVEGATLFVTFRQTGDQSSPQDMIAFSVGSEKPTFFSRASIRVDKDGYLTGIARASDSEEGQTIRAKEAAPAGEVHQALLIVDYAKNLMQLYLNGKLLESEGVVKFSSSRTAPTPSKSMALGAEDDGSNFFFKGELSHPMVWGRVLSADEISEIFKKKAAR